MRILFATHEGVPLYGGGPDVKIRETRRYLADLGVTVELFDMWKAPEQLRRCDLVHLFGANFAMYNLARNLRYQNIRFVVNPIFYSRRSAATLRAISRIDRVTRRWLHGVWWEFGFTRDICHWAEMVLPNTAAEGLLVRQGFDVPAEKIRVVHNGVSPQFLAARPEVFHQKYGPAKFILHVGHLGPARKNVLNLVRALAKVDCPAVLIDRVLHTGEAESVLAEIRRHKHIRLIDGLPHHSPLLAAAFAACDVFVLPSQFETPGRAALEAALAGAKIVITPHGGTKEYFGEYAEYVNPYSVADIRRGIEQALRQPPNPELREHIRRHFLWEKIAADTLAIYREVLASPR